MRVTASTFPSTLINQLSQLTVRQNRLQSQAATGQRVQYPEDDPSAMRRVLDLQSESKVVEQYRSNISLLLEQTTASYDVMSSLKKISDRAGEITTLADGTKSPEQLKAYSAEVAQLIQQAVQLSNGKYRGDYLLGGTRTDQPPFTATTDSNGNVTSVTYSGGSDTATVEIAEGVTFSAQTLGANNSGSGPRGLITDSRSGADFFNHLISLQQHLDAGDTASISSIDRNALAKDEDNFIFHFGTVGALQSRLEAASAASTNRSASIEKLVSQEADADLAETLVRLGETQNAYKAALQSGSTILNQSLLDFIR